MFNLKPDLRPGEAVLAEYGATLYLVQGTRSSAGANRRLWLTDQRLLLKAGIGLQRSYPLRLIASISEHKISWHEHMLRIEFQNGELLWLTVQSQPEFVRLLEQTRLYAPALTWEMPPVKYGPRQINRTILIIVLIIACIVMCILFVCFLFPLLLYILILQGLAPTSIGLLLVNC
jgi:hypothetical protein